MMHVIDTTLSGLDGYDPTVRQLNVLCGLLLKIGADYTEISVEAFRKMGSLPPIGKYILRCENLEQVNDYPQFEAYVCRRIGKSVPANVISELQVNDIREIHLLSRYGKLDNVRIRGLDDLLNHDYEPAFDLIRQTFKGRIQICPEDRYDCATAIAVEWLLSGGKEAAASFAGVGGVAPIEEVLMALRIEIRRKPNVDFSIFPEIKALIEEITNESIPKNKPVIGEDIFHVEAGIHVDGISSNPKIYEPFRPELVGNTRKLVIGKHSGRAAVIVKMKELGLNDCSVTPEKLLLAVHSESVHQQQSLTDEDFIRLYRKMAGQPDNIGNQS